MSQRLVVFISSTVEDLDGTRRAIHDALEDRGMVVRLSEDPDFPVEPGVTSHDACLRAVRTSHVFVLLVGMRFGGEYQGQNKSITWREWEEAMDAGLLPIVLVDQDANALARRIYQARRAIERAHPDLPLRAIDERLRADPDFADAKPARHNLPGVQRFIDALRKGHVDNWMHADWDRSPAEALRRIDLRLNTALAVGQASRQAELEAARREALRFDAIRQVAAVAAELGIDVRRGAVTRMEAAQTLLDYCALSCEALLGYREHDLFNFVVYLREGDELVPRLRAVDPAIQTRGRRWKVGQGHVGRAFAQNLLMVSGDIRHTDAWVPSRAQPTDETFYVSAISAPFSYATQSSEPEGVAILTSNRVDHFRRPDQTEVLTAETLVNMLSLLMGTSRDASDARDTEAERDA